MKRFLYWQMRIGVRPFLAPWVPLWLQRLWIALGALTLKRPAGLKIERVGLGGVPGRRLTLPSSRSGQALLYFHGGGYVFGGPATSGKLAAQVGAAAGCEVFFVDYRLAPEHPFPAALDDALAAHRWLLEQKPQRVFFGGDSAGGGLALATALALRDRKLPLPAALVLISPFVDLTLSGESHRTHAARDPVLRKSWLAACAAHYAGGRAPEDPGLSPVFGDLSGLPPMLIQVGSEEILLSDSERLAKRAQKAGTRARLSCYDGLWHIFQMHAGLLEDSDRALKEIGEFVAHA